MSYWCLLWLLAGMFHLLWFWVAFSLKMSVKRLSTKNGPVIFVTSDSDQSVHLSSMVSNFDHFCQWSSFSIFFLGNNGRLWSGCPAGQPDQDLHCSPSYPKPFSIKCLNWVFKWASLYVSVESLVISSRVLFKKLSASLNDSVHRSW